MKEKICIIGSGNWGSAISLIVGKNVLSQPDMFCPQVAMWVFEETIEGRKLTDIINSIHINIKYLPGVSLPSNLYVHSDLETICKDATLLIFVIPHQFVGRICEQLKGKLHPRARAVSLIKGMDIIDGQPVLISSVISKHLDIDVCVLMGANVANEVAQGKFCESTLGYADLENAQVFRKVFNDPNFQVGMVNDVWGVEFCGALKNVVAIGAGLVDGLDLGNNAKAAIIRLGMLEMKEFIRLVAESWNQEPCQATYFESCGIADLVTTCFGGRNRRLAEMHVRTGKSFDQLEQEALNGQKLQGTLTSHGVYQVVRGWAREREFPVFVGVYRVCYENMSASDFVNQIRKRGSSQ